MFAIDWSDLQLYHYMAIGGGGLALIALVLYFVLPRGVKIPVGIISTVAALVAGVGVGVIAMAAFGYQPLRPSPDGEGAAAPPAPGAPPGKGPGKGPGMGMPGMGGPGMGGGKGKGKGPTPKTQLVQLVGKMQQLTDKPLTLTLSGEQRNAIREQLKDLAEPEELTDEYAKQRLDAILEVVKDDRKTLEAAGFLWPEAGGFGHPIPSPPNPFKGGEGRERLLSLQGNLINKK